MIGQFINKLKSGVYNLNKHIINYIDEKIYHLTESEAKLNKIKLMYIACISEMITSQNLRGNKCLINC